MSNNDSRLAAFKEVKVDISNNVATITFFRPNRGNAISSQMGDEVVAALKMYAFIIAHKLIISIL